MFIWWIPKNWIKYQQWIPYCYYGFIDAWKSVCQSFQLHTISKIQLQNVCNRIKMTLKNEYNFAENQNNNLFDWIH